MSMLTVETNVGFGLKRFTLKYFLTEEFRHKKLLYFEFIGKAFFISGAILCKKTCHSV